MGSVRWGWEVDGGREARILPLEKLSDGASGDFKAAAGRWNVMQAPETRGSAAGPTRPVPPGLQFRTGD